MKNATSELTSVLVVCASVAILVAFFFYTIGPMMRKNFNEQTACEKATCEGLDKDGDGFVNCAYEGQIIRCKFKG